MTFIADFGMDVETAAHHPRIDVAGTELTTADEQLPAEVLDALAADGALEVVERAASPTNFASPNVIVQSADGTRIGISDAASPWSSAVAQA
jgi:gamma-glutamyltranspeptidase/glutathione hydrolase